MEADLDQCIMAAQALTIAAPCRAQMLRCILLWRLQQNPCEAPNNASPSRLVLVDDAVHNACAGIPTGSPQFFNITNAAANGWLQGTLMYLSYVAGPISPRSDVDGCDGQMHPHVPMRASATRGVAGHATCNPPALAQRNRIHA